VNQPPGALGLSLPFVAVQPPPGAFVFLTAQPRRRVCQPEGESIWPTHKSCSSFPDSARRGKGTLGHEILVHLATALRLPSERCTSSGTFRSGQPAYWT